MKQIQVVFFVLFFVYVATIAMSSVSDVSVLCVVCRAFSFHVGVVSVFETAGSANIELYIKIYTLETGYDVVLRL